MHDHMFPKNKKRWTTSWKKMFNKQKEAENDSAEFIGSRKAKFCRTRSKSGLVKTTITNNKCVGLPISSKYSYC